MKRSEELKIEKGKKVERMQALLNLQKGENKRALSDVENTEFTTLKAEVETLNADIVSAEFVERNAGPVPTPSPAPIAAPHIPRATSPHSVGKAIREFVEGGEAALTGIEKEKHDELARGFNSNGLLIPSMRDQNTTSGAASIDTQIHPSLVSVVGKEPLYKSMGITVLPGLHGSFKLGVKTPDVAEKVAEKAAITQTANQPTMVDLAPERYGITDIFTKELLAQRNPQVQAAIVADMEKGVDRKLTTDVYAVALAAATAVSAGAVTVDGFNALMAAVDADGAFAMTRESFFEAKGVKVDTGSGKFLAELTGQNGIGRTHDGAAAFYSTLFADGTDQQYLIYGAWEEIWMGLWGAQEILLNPYTYQKNGQIEMTVNKLAKIVNRNSTVFVKSADLDV